MSSMRLWAILFLCLPIVSAIPSPRGQTNLDIDDVTYSSDEHLSTIPKHRSSMTKRPSEQHDPTTEAADIPELTSGEDEELRSEVKRTTRKNKRDPAGQMPSAQIASFATKVVPKRGLAYNWQSPSLASFTPYKKLGWAYNWDSFGFNLPSQFSFVPTLHAPTSQWLSSWANNVAYALAASAKTGSILYLMSFNEPDIKEQANISPSAAVAAWNKYMRPYASPKVRLASPSVSNGVGINPKTNQPMGLDWLRPFLSQCSGCPISFVPVHWYGCTDGCPVAQDVRLFKLQMKQAMAAASVGGKQVPIWITEFQCFGDASTFLEQVLPWLDSQPQVERYSYFMVWDGILTQNGKISPLGIKYATL